MTKIDVYLEIGKKRTFAGAIDWPGWCRSARDERSALQTLVEYGPRYARVLHDLRLEFHAPAETSALTVVERLEGNAGTDFGVPDISPNSDARPVVEDDLRRFEALLKACWRAFDAAVMAAGGKELRKGPRGGGRSLEQIVRHLREAEGAYVRQLGWKHAAGEDDRSGGDPQSRQEALVALGAAARGELPRYGPRGGAHWTPRYFVRRTAWHALDHAWEIEDRITLE